MDVSSLFQSVVGRVAVAARSEANRYAQWAQGMLGQAQTWPAVAAAGVTCACRLVTPQGPALCRAPGIGQCCVCGGGLCLDHAYISSKSMVCSGCVAAARVQHGGGWQRQEPSKKPTREDCLKAFRLGTDATADQIKDRYKTYVKRYHPDHAKNEADRLKREQKMREVNAVFETLSKAA